MPNAGSYFLFAVCLKTFSVCSEELPNYSMWLIDMFLKQIRVPLSIFSLKNNSLLCLTTWTHNSTDASSYYCLLLKQVSCHRLGSTTYCWLSRARVDYLFPWMLPVQLCCCYLCNLVKASSAIFILEIWVEDRGWEELGLFGDRIFITVSSMFICWSETEFAVCFRFPLFVMIGWNVNIRTVWHLMLCALIVNNLFETVFKFV